MQGGWLPSAQTSHSRSPRPREIIRTDGGSRALERTRGVVVGQAIFAALPTPVLALMVVGGGLCNLGVLLYLWKGLLLHYTIWHVIVLAASLLIYAAVEVFLLG